MKKFIVLLLPALLSAETVIEDSLSAYKEAEPDTLEKSISITLKSAKSIDITQKFEQLIESARAHRDVCKGGSYTNSPVYEYKDGKTIFSGYSGTMNFECSFAKSSDFEPFYNNVINKLSNEYKINLGQSRWVVSKKLNDAITTDLKIESLKSAQKLTKTYESELEFKRCSLLSVNLSQNSPSPQPVFRAFAAKNDMLEGSSIELNDPMKENALISVFAQVKMECR